MRKLPAIGEAGPCWANARPSPGVSRLLHITFATPDFSQSVRALRRSARRFGVENIEVYTPDSPAVQRAFAENPQIKSNMRGVGYWLWKPYIVLDAMERVPEGTLVLYTDAGVAYIDDLKPVLALADTRDVVLFNNRRPEWTQQVYTKRDCFVLLDADCQQHWERRQLDAAFQLYRVGDRARAFVTELKESMRDPRVLTDASNACGLPNLPGFREHRHDQSILTILAVRHGLETFRTPKALPAAGDRHSLYTQIFHHHRRRNVRMMSYAFRQIGEAFGLTSIDRRS